MLKVINVKEDYPDSDYAIYLLSREIEISKISGVTCLVIIHGYGSHGVGGTIRSRVHKYLSDLKRKKVIYDYIPGDKWSEHENRIKDLYKCEPECIINENLRTPNSGITLVWISRNDSSGGKNGTNRD